MTKEPRAMKEIHEVMERSYEKRKGLSDEEMLKQIHNSSEELMKKYKLKLRRPEKRILQKV